MADIRVPEWEQVTLGATGGTYDPGRRIKLCWHTWEGTSWESAEDTYFGNPPHAGAKIGDRVRQYVPLNRHSFALRGDENDDELTIQIEVAGHANRSRDLTDDQLRWLATEVLDPLNRALAAAGMPTIPAVLPPKGFRDEDDGEFLPLAVAGSLIRFTRAEYEAYSGHMGHQHAPSPNHHWDPGFLDVARIISFSSSSTPDPEDTIVATLTDAQARQLVADAKAAAASAAAAARSAQRAVEILEGRGDDDGPGGAHRPAGKATGTLLARIRDNAADQTGLLKRVAAKVLG
jgi:hypothetical protein